MFNNKEALKKKNTPKNRAHIKENYQSTETTPEKDLMSDTLDKDFKREVLTMFYKMKMWRMPRKQSVNEM